MKTKIRISKLLQTGLILLAVLSMPVSGQTINEMISKANDLVANKKYSSAFKTLMDFDPKDENPDVVLLKEDIALNYFVTSMMHQMFALKDLDKNETVMDFRGKEGVYDMYSFSVNDILDKLIKKYPTNYKLYKGLADFYSDVMIRYPGNWLKKDNVLSDLVIKNYQVVIDHQAADYTVYYKVGLEFLSLKKHKESIPYFLESLKLKVENADTHYNLAYAYLFTDDRENALKHARKSFDMYTDKTNKEDAARMIGQIFVELKNDRDAIRYYEIANGLEADNYYNLHPLLSLYVKSTDPKAKETMNTFYNLAPDKPTIYNDLGNIYHENSKTSELIDFYLSRLPTYANDKKISGNLHFYLGQLYLESDKKTAKDYFLKAKAIFSTVFDKNNGVFNAINEGIKLADKK
jgi:tetratricopeptide (TPR) repeat protein